MVRALAAEQGLAHAAGLEIRRARRADGAAEETDAAREPDAIGGARRAEAVATEAVAASPRVVRVRAGLVEEPAGFLEDELELHELGARSAELVRVGGDLAELLLERLEPRLELVEPPRARALGGVRAARAGDGDQPRFLDLLGEVPELAEHLVRALHLVRVRALERAAVGVQIAKLHEAEIAELRDRVPRSLRGDDQLHQLHRLGAKELHRGEPRSELLAPGAGMAKGAAEANPK